MLKLTAQRTGGSVLFCLMLVLLTSQPAGAAPTWLSPVNLSEAGQMAGSPQVAIDQRGGITVIWDRSNGSNYETQAAFRSAGGAWQAPVTLSEAGYDTGGAQVGVDPEGDAVAVWEAVSPAGHRTIQSAVKSAFTGAWSAPATLASIGEPVGKPQVAVDSHGDAVAVWEEQPQNLGRQFVQAAARPAGGSWSAPIDVSEGSGGRDPSIAMDSEGNAIVTWLDFDSVQSAVRLASTGAWQAPVNVATAGLDAGGHPGGPALAVDGQGDAAVVWSSAAGNGANHIVHAATLLRGSSWQTPVELSDAGWNAGAPHVALDPHGDATVVWSAAEGGSDAVIRSAVKPAGGLWQTLANIAETGEIATNQLEPRLAVDPQGNAIAVWEGMDGGHQVIQSAVRTTESGNWQAPVELSESGPGASYPKVGVDPQGNAVAVWERGAGEDIVQAAGYDTGPLLYGPSIPSAGTVGEPLHFSVSPLGVWSALGETSWSLGDGTETNGTNITHTYTTPGIYKVTLKSVDALGNASDDSAIITISPTSMATPVPTIARQRLVLSGASLTNKRFSVAKQRTALAAKSAPLGTTFHFTLSAVARLEIEIRRSTTGLRQGRDCVTPSTKLVRAHAKRCMRMLTVGTLTRGSEPEGADSVSFSGRIGNHALIPHTYTAVLRASNGGGHSQPVTLTFVVVHA